MAKLPVHTAKEINEAHQFAKECAENAVEWAIKCGRMLARKKDELGRGGFDGWLETYCDFGRSMAYNYMKAAKSSNALDGFTSIRQALGIESKPKAKPNAPKGTVPVVNPKGTGETGTDRPAASAVQPSAATPASSPQAGEPERPEWEPEDDALLAETEKQIAASTDKVMAADDKLAAAHAEIKRQAAEIAVLKLSRDSAMNARAAAIKQLQAEQRKVARLEKELDKIKGRKAA
jgi:hypothetical protein